MMTKINLDSPDYYINRELSWLEFNERLLQEGLDESLPLLERLKFMSIFSSNLDEFFMIRAAGLKHILASALSRSESQAGVGLLLEKIGRRVHRMVADHTTGLTRLLAACADHGLTIATLNQWSTEESEFSTLFFKTQVQPLLTPLAVATLDPFPTLPGLSLNVAILLKSAEPAASQQVAVIPVPASLGRFIPVQSQRRHERFILLEEVIADNAARLFPGYNVVAKCVFRITRDADIAVESDDAADILDILQQAVKTRKRRAAVRLELSSGAHPFLRNWLIDWLDLTEADVYEITGLLDACALMEMTSLEGFDKLRYAAWPQQQPIDLIGYDDVFAAVRDHDVLLVHPYESFEPVINMIDKAADDDDVLAIKQTLYRTSGTSPIIKALSRAAERGKHVTVLVELKARFDEARNVVWARQLEDAGCHVIYGISGLKTHAKMLLIIRREYSGIRRYVHLSTGNYNEKTAALYSDVGLLTSDPDFGKDASAFFNLLTGYSQPVGWSKLTVAPLGLKTAFLDLIEREIKAATPDQPGLIMAKVNSLQDSDVCKALYKAGAAGIQVLLNVRGICTLKPGIVEVSENIRVVSIIDRYLEHARIFYFRNGGHEEVYLSSADWMERNLTKRIEVLFPVVSPILRQRLIGMLKTYLADNAKAWQLNPNGLYDRVKKSRPVVRAQETIYNEICRAVKDASQPSEMLRPLLSPKNE
jgi:polyphosphate kinase